MSFGEMCMDCNFAVFSNLKTQDYDTHDTHIYASQNA